MKQPDFFRLFAEKMQSATPPPDFSGEDWQALQGRLNAHDRKRNRVLPLGWLFGLTGLLLLSNLGWLWLWQKTGDEVSGLRCQLQHCDTATPHTQRDTIFEKYIVYQYDTIFKTVVLARAEPIAQARALASQGMGIAPFFDPRTSGLSIANASGQLRKQDDHSSAEVQAAAGTGGEHNASSQSTPMVAQDGDADMAHLTELLPILAIQPFDVSMRHPILPPTDDIMVAAKREPTAFPLIPKSYTLDLSLGDLTSVADGLSSSDGILAAVTGEIGFSDHLSLRVEGSLGKVRLKGESENASLGLPALLPPGDDYKLKDFETNFEGKPIVQLGLGMRWYLWPHKKLNPWLGAGWTTQWNPSYQLQVRYTHLPTGMETIADVDVPTIAKPLSYLGLNLGLRYRVKDKWHLKGGLYSDFKLSGQAGIGNWWGWRGGLMYQF